MQVNFEGHSSIGERGRGFSTIDLLRRMRSFPSSRREFLSKLPPPSSVVLAKFQSFRNSAPVLPGSDISRAGPLHGDKAAIRYPVRAIGEGYMVGL